MILRRLRVPSFAGLAGAELELSAGLNVIVGPNEAGKSTLFQALVHTLLTPAKLAKPRFQRTMQPFLPVGGGDTIEAELHFDHRGRGYRLRKRWGASPEAELELPDGARLTAEEAIQASLHDLLPADEATLRTVFLTYQSGLAATLEELSAHPEALQSLSDLLRRSLLESDQVSIGRFQDLLDQRIRALLDHWDLERERPEGGRNWDNPWKKNVGSALQRFYEVLALEARHLQTLELEESYEQRLRLLESCQERLEELQGLLAAQAPVVEDAQRRGVLESRRETAAIRLESLEKTYAEWSDSLLTRQRCAEERVGLAAECEGLEAEHLEADRYARGRAARERFARARELKERWDAARSALQDGVAVPAPMIEGLRNAAAELQRLEGALSGGAMRLRLEARARLDLSVTRDIEEPETRGLDAGDGWELEARGRVRFEHRDWTLEVTSGEGDFGELARLHGEARTRLRSLLQAAGVTSLEEAEQIHRRYERLVLEAEAARRSFEEALAGQPWERLEAEAQQLPPDAPHRRIEEVVSELAKARTRLGRLDDRLGEAEGRIAVLESSHESREALLHTIGEHRARLQELDAQLSGLSQLPEGCGDAQMFLSRHRQLQQEQGSLRERRAGLDQALQEAVLHMPEETAEELASRLEEARRLFQQGLREARALLRVRETADALLESLDDSTLDGFRRRFGEYVQALSGARYRGSRADTLLPEALERDDDTVLRYELLSAGTRDLFSLALRLAMAELMLAGGPKDPGPAQALGDEARREELTAGEGFLVMDDPLVDMDPKRRQLAAVVLARFAEGQQLVVFTCHPTHAELLTACVKPGSAAQSVLLG